MLRNPGIRVQGGPRRAGVRNYQVRFGRRQANAAPDASNDEFPRPSTLSLLLGLLPLRRVAARTLRIFLPRATHSVSAGRLTPPSTRQAAGSAALNALLVAVVAAAPRSGANSFDYMDRRPASGTFKHIDIRRAAALDSVVNGKFFLTSVSFVRRPLSNISFKISPLRGPPHQHPASKRKFNFCASADRRFHFLIRTFQKFFFRHHEHKAQKSKFEISRSRERGVELLGLQVPDFFLPLRGALKTINLVNLAKSAKLKKNFFAARLTCPFFLPLRAAFDNHCFNQALLITHEIRPWATSNSGCSNSADFKISPRLEDSETGRETGFSTYQKSKISPGSQ
ncbi:hypothetical protein R3P38DRAFT_2799805 [Favolaschia claudopus]|uniref:Uncharacterized protein n=1 Tax=Favolaschia claudopus TaxID=2862362 RepID=A0AAW0A0L8_9AGAR